LLRVESSVVREQYRARSVWDLEPFKTEFFGVGNGYAHETVGELILQRLIGNRSHRSSSQPRMAIVVWRNCMPQLCDMPKLFNCVNVRCPESRNVNLPWGTFGEQLDLTLGKT
jgi:hypothetical protein